MLYEINSDVTELSKEEFILRAAQQKDNLYAGVLTLQELKLAYADFGFADSTISVCESQDHHMINALEVYDSYSFGILNVIDSSDVHKKADRVGFYVKKNLFLVIDIFDEDKSTVNALDMVVTRMKQGNTTLEKIIYGFLSRLIFQENIEIEKLELTISQMEKRVFSNDTKNFNDQLLFVRKKLLKMRNYYEQLVNLGEDLIENENDIFDEENLRYFKLFTDRVERLSNNVQMLRDYISQVREAYQAQMDYNLNSIMKVFTVVTTIFLPLTLIVGWYGMNFTNMPELTWKYGYLAVIILSIIVVSGCIVFFRKKKLL